MNPEDEAATPGVAASLDALTQAVAELREGQDELLRLYEELGERYPKDCLCAGMRDRARRELLALDLFPAEPENFEDYRPE